MLSEEMRLQRINTEAYIASDPSEVVLRYRPSVDNGAGGLRQGPEMSREPQIMRLVEENTGGDTVTYNVDGKSVTANYSLIGAWNARMAAGDRFRSEDGHEFQVVFVRPDQRYQRTAEVVYRGS